MKNKNSTMSEQFQNQIQKYHTVGTVSKSNTKIAQSRNSFKIKYKNSTYTTVVKRGKMDTSSTHIHLSFTFLTWYRHSKKKVAEFADANVFCYLHLSYYRSNGNIYFSLFCNFTVVQNKNLKNNFILSAIYMIYSFIEYSSYSTTKGGGNMKEKQ